MKFMVEKLIKPGRKSGQHNPKTLPGKLKEELAVKYIGKLHIVGEPTYEYYGPENGVLSPK